MAFFKRAVPAEAPTPQKPASAAAAVSLAEYRSGLAAGVKRARGEIVEAIELCMRSGDKDAKRLVEALKTGTLAELQAKLAIAKALRGPLAEADDTTS